MPWEPGERVVYLDLDVVITGRLEPLFERDGIIQDWHWPMFNSSAMSWIAGERDEVWERFCASEATRPSPLLTQNIFPRGQINGGDQEWITRIYPDWPTWPPTWFPTVRRVDDWPPDGTVAVVFHGSDKPATDERAWVKDIWRIGGLTSLPEMKGINVTHEQIFANVRAAVKRDLAWFSGFGKRSQAVCIVGGAPSLLDDLDAIRAQKRRGARIISTNNAWRTLVNAGIKPDGHCMLDARPENAAFVADAPDGVTYFIASQCHPDVFDALANKEVVMWHNAIGDTSELRDILAPWWDAGPDQRPCILVPGGCTVVLRALWLAAFSGYRTIHLYGADSSYAENGAHHAYPQALNEGERVLQVQLKDRTYRCAPWMARQAREFQEHWIDLRKEGVTVHVHGKGLLPDMAAILHAQARAA
jgi:hypothetical protein